MAPKQSNSFLEILLTSACGLSIVLGALSEFTLLLPEQLSLYFYIISYISGGYSGLRETLSHLAKFELNIGVLVMTRAAAAAALAAAMRAGMRRVSPAIPRRARCAATPAKIRHAIERI